MYIHVDYKYVAEIFAKIARGFERDSNVSVGSKLLTFRSGVDKGQARILSVIS